MPVPTAIRSASGRLLQPLPTSFIEAQVADLAEHRPLDAALIGNLSTLGMIETVASLLEMHWLDTVVLDLNAFPRDRYGRIPADLLEAVGLFLAPQVSLAVMDDDLAERLTGVPICEPTDLVTAARKVRRIIKVDAVVLRGVERVTGPYDVQVLSEGQQEHRHQVVPCLSQAPVGLDAVYAAAAVAHLAHGLSRSDAAQAAQQYAAEVHRCTATAPGAVPLADPFAFLGAGVVFAG
ncbi:MAG: hypothetical protein RhofKO_10980 [Rhodothermales bacterium]